MKEGHEGPDNKGIARMVKSARRDRAKTRQAERNERSAQEQLLLLEQRGHAHCGEAQFLRAFIEGAQYDGEA